MSRSLKRITILLFLLLFLSSLSVIQLLTYQVSELIVNILQVLCFFPIAQCLLLLFTPSKPFWGQIAAVMNLFFLAAFLFAYVSSVPWVPVGVFPHFLKVFWGFPLLPPLSLLAFVLQWKISRHTPCED